ncbi:uncharacterized protein LOC115713553 [Cannabis sativa]|uniref:uncharacterized protein LOC115713553 n=1 Tax=Cannabis sativa TaxID=3483 RepID=UPI0029C9E22F|nr:uncharacterized protein LOC115713553 [Cannabis sativa]
MKVPDGYSSNIKNLVNEAELKLMGMKSHDCHALMQHLLPIAIRLVLPKNIRECLTHVCIFFNKLCRKELELDNLDALHEYVVKTLCNLENLCSDNIDNVVARAYLYEHDGLIKVYCKDYDDSHARVLISEMLQKEVEIPISIEGCRYVKAVANMFLPWPKYLIVTPEGRLAQPLSRRDASKGKGLMPSPQGGDDEEDELFSQKVMDLIPNSLKWMVAEFLRIKDKRDIITIPVPRQFIAPRLQITLFGEDLQQVALCDFIGNQGMLYIWESIKDLRIIFKFYDLELLAVNDINDEEKSQSFDNALLYDIHFLEAPFTHTEIEKAFHQLPLDKAPGIDGFNSQFYKDNWSFLRNDVINAALSFLNGDGDIAPLNTTLITLIPKVKNPTVLTEYRPISLCSIVYKIISKSIANKLKLVLNNLISPNQSAFLPGRLISDNIIIAQEVAHSIKLRTHGRKGWMAVKLDMAKAFDRVEWAFIAAILNKFLFPQRLINLILACLSTATFQFNFNGQVAGNVVPTRGIRQGDPLSPYLFLLCAEGLSSLIQQKERNRSLMGYKVARRAPAVSHLLFADDSFLFCNASIQSCNIIKEILEMYERASGQKVNFQKSSLYFSPNVELRDQTLISDFLQIPIRSSFENYLGLPQHIGRSKKQMFHYLDDKVWAHLHNWKNKVFSKGGKVILLKSVIQAIPTYTMACFRIPSATCHSLESIMANFWWGFNDNNRPKIHWQSWQKLCKSKKDGGLGFRSLIHFNQALLAKQAWRIFKQPNSLVSKILEARYYPNSSFLNSALGHSPSFVWRSICWGRELLQKGLISKIANGQSTSTTGTHWIPGFRQHTTFDTAPPTVAAFITPTMTWNIALLERYYPPHVIDAILSIPLPLQPSNDELIWELSSSGIYTVKTGYHLSFSSFTPPDIPSSSSPSPWWKNLWHLKIPPKVKHFAFRATNSTLPTLKSLASRKIIPSSVCERCGNMEESCLMPCSTAIVFEENKARKDQAQDKTHAILTLARNFLDDYNLPSSGQSSRTPPSRLSHPTPWTLPAQGCLKLNVDASTTKDRLKAGFGGVIRNSEGLVVAALASPYLGGGTVASLEAKSLLRMLQWCIEEHFHVHEIETDCKTITDALSSSCENISAFGDTLKQIKDALSLLPAAQVSHVPRSANTFADKLAHWAAGLDEAAIWIGDDPCDLRVFLSL